MSKYIDVDRLKAEIDKRYTEYRAKMKTDDFTYYEGMADALDLFEQFLDSIQEQPVEGLDVTDFCKPVDPSIAKCVADHWWEMIGEESTNKKLPEELEDGKIADIIQNLFPTDQFIESESLLLDRNEAILFARYFYELGLNAKGK